ncbi:MAG: hypothetical protein PHQ96_01125 [Candidatus Omnitrophica bacterium]|nr:hypothetical protein [Candidatus Omnitrophota bacterium]
MWKRIKNKAFQRYKRLITEIRGKITEISLLSRRTISSTFDSAHQNKKIFLALFVIAGVSFSAFLFTQEASSYQVKRVIRGNYSLPIGTETNTTDISSLLGGEGLNISTSFITISRRHADDERTYGDIMATIDDENNLLFARFVSTTAIDVNYQVVELLPAPGVSVQSGTTIMPESKTSKNITLPQTIALNRSLPFLSWRSPTQSSSGDEMNIFAINLTTDEKFELRRSEVTGGYNNELAYYIVTFDRDVNVAKNVSLLSGKSVNASVSVTDMNKTLLVFYTMPGANVNGIEAAYYVRGYLASPNNITFQRWNTTDSVTIYWYLAEFQNQPLAEIGTGSRINVTALAYSNITNVTISPQWVLNRTFLTYSQEVRNETSRNATDESEDTWTVGYLSQTGTDVNVTFERWRSTATVQSVLLFDYNVMEFQPLDVITPNGAGSTDNKTVGQVQTISWQNADSSKNHTFNLRLCKNNCNVIAGYTTDITNVSVGDANSGSYNWPIANIVNNTTNPINGTLRVAIVDTSMFSWLTTNQSTRNWDIGNGNFSINGSIDLTYPDGGETVYIGQKENIQWDKTGNFNYTNFKIELYNGSAWTTVASPLGQDQANVTCDQYDDICSYAWTVPANYSGNKKIRVSINDNYPTPVNDSTAGVFSITGSLDLTSPVGEEAWNVTDTNKVINWTHFGNYSALSRFNINLSTNNGGAYDKVIKSNINETGNCTYQTADRSWKCGYLWNPIWYNSSDQLKVKVYAVGDSANITDNSTSNFTIKGGLKLNWPNTTDVWYANTNGTINWTRYGNWTAPYSTSAGRVNISYYFQADGILHPIVNNTTGICANYATYSHCYYNWTLSGDDVGSNLKINISSVQPEALQVFNESLPFNTSAFVTVTKPVAGTYRVGDDMNISWNMSGSFPSSCVCYSSNNGANWLDLGVNNTAGETSFSRIWTIPEGNTTVNPAVNNSYIRVANGSCTNLPYDDSPGFKVRSNITVTNPYENQIVRINSSLPIIFNTDADMYNKNVSIKFASDGSTFDLVLKNNLTVDELTESWPWNPVNASITATGKIKVELMDDPNNVNDTSDQFFVKGKVEVFYPNDGTEVFYVGQTNHIYWNYSGDIGTLELRYTTDNWGASNETIEVGVNRNLPYYNWSTSAGVPLTSNASIGIFTSDSQVYDESNNTFYIRGILNVTQPNASSVFIVGEEYAINWTGTGDIGDLNLSYSNNSGPWIKFASNIDFDDYSYLWKVNNTIGDKVRVKIERVEDNDNYNISPEFTVKGKFIMQNPGTLIVDSYPSLNWTTNGTIDFVNISYVNQTGVYSIKTDAANGNGWDMWQVPDNIASTNFIRIEANNSAMQALSNASNSSNFAIKGKIKVIWPNASTVALINGTTPDISFETNGTVGNVSIRLNDGTTWYTITNNTTTGPIRATNIYYDWIVNNTKSETCKLNITSKNDPTVNNESELFAIRPKITVLSPNSTHVLRVTNNYTNLINWTITGNKITYVDILYDIANGEGGYPYEIARFVDANLGVYNWTNVPQRITSGSPAARIKIVDNSSGISPTDFINGTSDPFEIIGKVIVTSPAADANVTIKDTSIPIEWTAKNVTGLLRIYYSTTGVPPWTAINTSAAPGEGAGIYTYWNPNNCDVVSNTTVIHVNSSADSRVNYTTGNFTTLEQFSILHPENEVVIANNTVPINWTTLGATNLPQVNLTYYNGSAWLPISATAANNGNYSSWKAPDDTQSLNFKVRVASTANANNYNESAPAFTVHGNITVKDPNGGETWKSGTTYPINWTYSGPMKGVNIWYYYNYPNEEANNKTQIAENISIGSAGNGTWPWPILASANLSANKARILVVENDTFWGSYTRDFSNSNFTVKGDLRVDAPNGTGVVAYVGTSYQINWTRFGEIQTANLYYTNL